MEDEKDLEGFGLSEAQRENDLSCMEACEELARAVEELVRFRVE